MDIDLIFKALANPTRRQILEWLKHPEQFLSEEQCGGFKRGVCAGNIEKLGNRLRNTASGRIFPATKRSFSSILTTCKTRSKA